MTQIQNIPFYQSWSLGIEEKFYIFWPVLAFIVWRCAKWLFGTAVLTLLWCRSDLCIAAAHVAPDFNWPAVRLS